MVRMYGCLHCLIIHAIYNSHCYIIDIDPKRQPRVLECEANEEVP